MDVARVDPSGVDAGAIGFRLAPRINAAGRLHRADAGLELLLTTDVAAREGGRGRARRGQRRAARRRDADPVRGRGAGRRAAGRAGGADPTAYVLAADGWHPGVIGIVASRIAERHHRPAVLIALDGRGGHRLGPLDPGLRPARRARRGERRAAAPRRPSRGGGADDRARARGGVPRGVRDARGRRAVAGGPDPASSGSTPSCPATRCGSASPRSSSGSRRSGWATRSRALLVPSALLDDPRPLGEGRHVAFTLAAGGARSRCVSFGRGGTLPAAPGEPVDAAVRLEVNRYNGAVEPRLVLRHAQPAAPGPIAIVGEASFESALRAELRRRPGRRGRPSADRPEEDLARAGRRPRRVPPAARSRDARGGGIAGLLGDLVAGGAPVLAVVAHAEHRRRALRDRVGGFTVVTWAALEADPPLAARYAHVGRRRPAVASAHLARAARAAPRRRLDAPGVGGARARARPPRPAPGSSTCALPLADLYRALRARRRAGAAALGARRRVGARVRGRRGLATPRCAAPAPQPPLRRAGGPPAARARRARARRTGLRAARGPAPARRPRRTGLERSPAFRAYQARLQAGLAHLGAPARAAEPATAAAA